MSVATSGANLPACDPAYRFAHAGYKLPRPAPFPLHRLEADPQPMPRRLGEAIERAGRGSATAAFEAGDGALRGLHAARKLGLTQPRADARLGDRLDEYEFLLQGFVLLA